MSENILWEQPGSKDWLTALVVTVKEILKTPTLFFHKVALGQNLQRPLLFALIINATMLLAGQAFSLGLGISVFSQNSSAAPIFPWLSALPLPLAIVLVALLMVLGFFMGAAINHFCLFLLGAAHRNFAQTLRVVCYASAPCVFGFVPYLGTFVGTVWSFTLMVIGFKVVHMTSSSRALFALLLPVLLCCGVSLALSAMGIALLGSVLGAGLLGG